MIRTPEAQQFADDVDMTDMSAELNACWTVIMDKNSDASLLCKTVQSILSLVFRVPDGDFTVPKNHFVYFYVTTLTIRANDGSWCDPAHMYKVLSTIVYSVRLACFCAAVDLPTITEQTNALAMVKDR